MKPKVSIVMPVLNGKTYIAEAIESICAQSYKNFELIVIDDGSTDNTHDIVRSYENKISIQYVRHESPRGIPSSMNDGIRHARGDLITFLDHDDLWFPEMLETQVGYLDQHSDIAMVHSDFQTVDSQGRVLHESIARMRNKTRPSGHVFPELFLYSFIVGNSVVVRRSCFDELGLFDETLRFGDYLMWLKIARHYKVDYIPKVLTKYRQHQTQSTRVAAGSNIAEPVACQAIKKLVAEFPEITRELGRKTIRRRLSAIHFDQGFFAFESQDFALARKCIGRAIGLNPTRLVYFWYYFVSLFHISQRGKPWRFARKVKALVTSKTTSPKSA